MTRRVTSRIARNDLSDQHLDRAIDVLRQHESELYGREHRAAGYGSAHRDPEVAASLHADREAVGEVFALLLHEREERRIEDADAAADARVDAHIRGAES